MKKKKKKEKVKYIDDGRSLADMSALGSRPLSLSGSHANYKDAKVTFFRTMKMMIVPMLITIGIISLAFLLMYLMLMSAA